MELAASPVSPANHGWKPRLLNWRTAVPIAFFTLGRWMRRGLGIEYFCIPRARQRVASTRVRLLAEADREACLDIFRMHQAGTDTHLGVFEEFDEWLANPGVLKLVIEQHGEVRAFGGINLVHSRRRHFAVLSHGLVHFDHEEQGLGTTLLLARLALLPRPFAEFPVLLSRAVVPKSFYRQFGFIHYPRWEEDEAVRIYRAWLLPDSWQECHDVLARNGVERAFGPAPVPVQTLRVSGID